MADNNKIVTAYDYLCLWHNKGDDRFHPDDIEIQDFQHEFGFWNTPDLTNERCLWHDGNIHSYTSVDDLNWLYKDVTLISISEEFRVTKNKGTKNKLITYGELDDFKLIIGGDSGTLYPPYKAGEMPFESIQVSIDRYSPAEDWANSPTFSFLVRDGNNDFDENADTVYYFNSTTYDKIKEITLKFVITMLDTKTTINDNTGTNILLAFKSGKSLAVPITSVTKTTSSNKNVYTVTATISNDEGEMKFADYCRIVEIDMENISFSTSPSTKYTTFDWKSYSLLVGNNESNSLSLLTGINVASGNPYVDIISLDGKKVYLSSLNVDPNADGSYNLDIIKIKESIDDQNTSWLSFYIRGQFENPENTYQKITLCFKAMINVETDTLVYANSERDGCAWWIDTAPVFLRLGNSNMNSYYVLPNGIENYNDALTLNTQGVQLINTFSNIKLEDKFGRTNSCRITWSDWESLGTPSTVVYESLLFSVIHPQTSTLKTLFQITYGYTTERILTIDEN